MPHPDSSQRSVENLLMQEGVEGLPKLSPELQRVKNLIGERYAPLPGDVDLQQDELSFKEGSLSEKDIVDAQAKLAVPFVRDADGKLTGGGFATYGSLKRSEQLRGVLRSVAAKGSQLPEEKKRQEFVLANLIATYHESMPETIRLIVARCERYERIRQYALSVGIALPAEDQEQ